MRRCGIEDLVLGQPTPTTSASVQRQLCGKVTYSRSRPEADLRTRCGQHDASGGRCPMFRFRLNPGMLCPSDIVRLN